MMDVVDRATRSRMMAGIKGRNTKPELLVRSLLHRRGFRFRLHRRDLPGRPDIVLPRYHAAIFVNGCFWHGHDCRLFRLPGTRRVFWAEKIGRNRKRDQEVVAALLFSGWRVGTIWECAIRGSGKAGVDAAMDSIESWLHGTEPEIELRE